MTDDDIRYHFDHTWPNATLAQIYSVHLLWHPRQAKWQKPHASEALGVSPTIELWGVRSKL